MSSATAATTRAGRILMRAELSRALRSRWFVAYAVLFLLLGAVLTALGRGGLLDDPRGAVRALAGLMHVLVLFVPVMAVIPMVASVFDDRESGLLEYTLAQPTGPGQLLVAKWGGVAAAMALAVTIGLLPGGAGAILRGNDPATVGVLLVTTLLLAQGFVSLGLLLAAATSSRARALALGVGAWLLFVVMGTLGLMTAFVRWGLPEATLAAWSLADPVEAFRLALLTTLGGDVGLLGPVGAGLVERLGAGGLLGVCLLALLAWAVVPGVVGVRLFRRRR